MWMLAVVIYTDIVWATKSTVLRISEAKRKKKKQKNRSFYFNWMFGYQMNVEDSKHSFFFIFC